MWKHIVYCRIFFHDRPNYVTIAAYRILKIKADLQDNTDSYSILFIYF